MKKVFAVLVVCGLLLGCGVHSVRHPMEGTWYSTIEKVDVQLDLTVSDKTVTGRLELLEDADDDLPKGSIVMLMDGSYVDETVQFYLDIDMDGKLSDEDVFVKLKLEDKETLSGYGYERDDPEDKRKLSFRRSR